MLHIGLHLIVPVIVAWAFYRPRWDRAAGILLVTMIVDVDHLLADPIYDPQRCSIGFHPLHGVPAIVVFCLLAVLPLILSRSRRGVAHRAALRAVHLVGLGLLIHMALDWGDCLL